MSNTWAPWTHHGLLHRPPRAWLWWASWAGGRRSIYRGWGHRWFRPDLRTPLLNGGGPGVSLPWGVAGVGPLWWGAPPGGGEGTGPPAPHVGGTGPSLCPCIVPGCAVWRVHVLRGRFGSLALPPLAVASRDTIFRVLDICGNLDRIRLLLAGVRYITLVNICYIT